MPIELTYFNVFCEIFEKMLLKVLLCTLKHILQLQRILIDHFHVFWQRGWLKIYFFIFNHFFNFHKIKFTSLYSYISFDKWAQSCNHEYNLFIHLLMITCVVSSIWLLWIKLLWIFMYVFCGHVFFFHLGKCRIVEWDDRKEQV